MNMKKKLLIVAGSAVGAVVILAQAVWADGKNTTTTANAPTQITAEEHAAHHPATAAAAANITVENKATTDEMMPMGDGNMADMMKMMETPEGKAQMEKCLELLKQQSEVAAQG